MITINSINGIPLHYARTNSHPYGTRGVQTNFQIEDTFLPMLENAFEEVFEKCPLGNPEVITTAGIFVNKPGQHGHGKAFDLDGLFWSDHQLVTSNFNAQKLLYIGIESILRRHFGIVLNYHYPMHHDHWHVDVSTIVDFHTSSKSETLYLQMALKHVYEKEVIVDGQWGPQTSGFTTEVFDRLKIDLPITTKVNYLKFLNITGKVAFKLSEFVSTPLDLLMHLRESLTDLPVAYQTGPLQSLNSFEGHQTTSDWLSVFDSPDLDEVIEDIIS